MIYRRSSTFKDLLGYTQVSIKYRGKFGSLNPMKKFENFSNWFDGILFNAEILDNRYPIKGFSVYKAWGSKIIKRITEKLEEQLDATGHDPMQFPVVISEDDFSKEAEHIKGFTAEVFWVTHAGVRELEKKMLLRPTSETAMYPMFATWIRSHSDLPLKIYQSVSVYRYETKSTRPLLRMREFLWNEAHTAHRDLADSEKQVQDAIQIYASIFKDLGLNYLLLKRPDFDKFAGAVYSIAFDAWNPDGRVNQIGTVHNLGGNFAKAFDITYEDVDGSHKNVTQTCYGFGTSRTLAAIIAQHGDDRGMVLPSEIAPIQVVIVPILYRQVEGEVEAYAREVYETIKNAGIRTHFDSGEKTPGEKFYHWEMFGVPVRVEIGPRDLKERQVTLSERVCLERCTVNFKDLVPTLRAMFVKITHDLETRSRLALESMVKDANDMNALKTAIKKKIIARISWCEGINCAETIKNESGGEIRGHRFDMKETPKSPCIVCGQKAEKIAYVAKAY